MSIQGIVFPGQGSQRPGMGLDFVSEFSESKNVFAQASEAIGEDLISICEGQDGRISLTEFTQPAILTQEIALFEALKTHFNLSPQYFAGHSLGEYAALVASGAVPLEIAVLWVRERGRLMQSCVPAGVGAMAAIISENLPREEMEKSASEANVDFANDNSKGQIVISGEKSAVDQLSADWNQKVLNEWKELGIRIVALDVSAPFHSRHMKPMEEAFKSFVQSSFSKCNFKNLKSVVSNYTGTFYQGSESEFLENLTRQISGRVKWRENIDTLLSRTHSILEIGPGRPLSGFFKTLGITVPAVTDLRSMKRQFSIQSNPVSNQIIQNHSGVSHANASI